MHLANPLRIVALAAVLGAPQGAVGASLADADALDRLDAYAAAVVPVHAQLLQLAEAASGAERFARYRSYNHAVATTIQIRFLREALHAAGDDAGRRADLAQQAEYAHWELAQHIATLNDAVTVDAARGRAEATLLQLLLEARETVSDLARPR